MAQDKKQNSYLLAILEREHLCTWNKPYEIECLKEKMKQDFIDYLIQEHLINVIQTEENEVVNIKFEAKFHIEKSKEETD